MDRRKPIDFLKEFKAELSKDIPIQKRLMD